MNIAENIKAKRIEKSFTQLELAERVGVSQVAIAKFENGSKIPNLITGYYIAQALNCSLDELVGRKKVD
ncbi:MAG: helix-turn-helix domain-containing protein [Oscillospiraceae bacterium]